MPERVGNKLITMRFFDGDIEEKGKTFTSHWYLYIYIT